MQKSFQKFNKKAGEMYFTESTLETGSVLPLLHFPELSKAEFVRHCFSTRVGGVSGGIFESMNLSFARGDDPTAVQENYRRIGEAMGVLPENMVCSDQTHTTNVRLVTKADAGNGVTREKNFWDTDGLITNTKGLVLATFYADCVPLYFVDPKQKAIGLSHSGWRGTVGRMGAATIQAMGEAFRSDPADLLCAIGPSICGDCYEVSEDVAAEFQLEFADYAKEIVRPAPSVRGKENQREFAGHAQEIARPVPSVGGEEKFQLDLWRANEIVLLEAGVPKENIETARLCTCCNPKLLFSHRASKGKRGNLGAFLVLR
ncbi:laccase domain protein [Clostridia bacterium]|nr:laccase domain protein [Clostridia bacterium]